MTDRIATFTQTSQIIKNNARLQSQYAERQIQVSTGYKSTNYEGIARDSARLLNLETDFARITQQTENAQIASDRVNLMFSSLNSMVEQTQKFIADLSSTISSFGLQGADLVNNAQTNLNQFAGQLNTQIADRYLFAGSATQTRPVDLNDPAWGGQLYVTPGPSVADTDYYQGNNYIQNVESIDGFTVNYGVTANNPAFEQIMRAYDLIITNPTDQDTLEEAFRIMNIAVDELAVLQASTSQRAQTLESQIADNETDLLLIEEQIVNIREIDVAEASVNLKQLEAQLEASYTVTAAMLNLKLSDYVR